MTSKTATILTRTEPEVKKAADTLFSRLGITTSGAINLFLRQAIKEHGIPFKITVLKPSIPDVSELDREKIAQLLLESEEDIKAGRVEPLEDVISDLEGKYGFRV